MGDLYFKAKKTGGPLLPSGVYIPNNTVDNPFQLLWVVNPALYNVGLGTMFSNGNLNYLYNCYFDVPHTGDFSLSCNFLTSGSIGLSIGVDIELTTQALSFPYFFDREGSNGYGWKFSSVLGSIGVVNDSTLFELERIGKTINFKKDGVIYFSKTDSKIEVFQAAFYSALYGGSATNIKLTIP